MEINAVNLVGRAGREPDVRYFESGSTVANFTLAVNRRSRDEEPDWFNIEIWGKQAQIAADYVRKGSLIGITGSLKIDTWKDKNTGEDRFKPVIRVDRLNLLGSKKDNETNNNYGTNVNNNVPFQNLTLIFFKFFKIKNIKTIKIKGFIKNLKLSKYVSIILQFSPKT